MQLEQLLQKFHDGTDLNLYVFDQENKLVEQFTTPLAPSFNAQTLTQIKQNNEKIALYLMTNHSSLGIINYDRFKIVGWNTNFTITGKGNYARKAPLLGYQQFSSLISLLYFTLFQTWPELPKAQKMITTGANIPVKENSAPSYEGYLAERELMDAVMKGNLTLFNKRFRSFIQHGNFGSFNQNELRSEKDLAISATTLYTRAAIQGGLPVSEAYNLSDQIIKQIEQDLTIPNYYEYTRSIGEIFINHVYRTKRKNLTSVIYKAQEFIVANYASIHNVDEIAEHLKISTSYLQHLFKKETGKSLIQFINEEKINQAKHKLIFSNKTVEEIAYDLGYRNQSQLSTNFKKLTKMTPIAFRKQYK
ncbi:AraC family transcriptional regulator [Lactobacillus sp. HT06-2]|uniref:AraC family transcriptional regulator n=1 Tax=Lactobacillus sp. HT06-2 TaxID=2080222 RepID=UPI000CD894CF|nr:AraC family transcriptional regulator [Lactobacillus sp. HT06-2]